MAARFEAFPDPLNNWIVWDLRQEDFAVHNGQFTDCLNEHEAKAICRMLNQRESENAPAMASAA